MKPKINPKTHNSEITIKVNQKEIATSRKSVIAKIAKDIKIKGFRQGKAPVSFVEKQIDQDKLKDEIIRDVVPRHYSKIIISNKLKPISPPKVSLISSKDNTPWEFKIEFAELPSVSLNDYKKVIKKIKITTKKSEKKPENEQRLNAIFDSLLENTSVNIPQVLVDEEVNNNLTRLSNQLNKINISIDQYLASVKKTGEEIQKEYEKTAQERLHLDFVLHKISVDEKLETKDEDLETFYKTITDKSTVEAIKKSPDQIASIKNSLSNQKVTKFLTSLLPKQSTKKVPKAKSSK